MEFTKLVKQQKEFLSYQLENSLKHLAQKCFLHLGDKNTLNKLLFDYLEQCTYANLAYVVDNTGIQISANIKRQLILEDFYEQDLSNRPFYKLVNKDNQFYLSQTYISTATLKPCISVVHAICQQDTFYGLVVLDLNLEKLPLLTQYIPHDNWQQIKGDPAIRANLFNQQRVQSVVYDSIDTVHDIAIELLCELDIFQIKIHYSSSRASIWTYSDPYNYHIYMLDEITSPDICLLYPKNNNKKNLITKKQVKKVFKQFKYLRFMDKNLYLRTGSINVISTMIGLGFSCDGNHYLTTDDFLKNIDNFY